MEVDDVDVSHLTPLLGDHAVRAAIDVGPDLSRWCVGWDLCLAIEMENMTMNIDEPENQGQFSEKKNKSPTSHFHQSTRATLATSEFITTSNYRYIQRKDYALCNYLQTITNQLTQCKSTNFRL